MSAREGGRERETAGGRGDTLYCQSVHFRLAYASDLLQSECLGSLLWVQVP